ncbi:MAG: serine--tRNA ligase [Pseudomonadota bacterium]
MFDIRTIRANPEAFDAGLKKRGYSDTSAAELIALDETRRTATTKAQEIQTQRNAASKQIGAAKKTKDEARASELMAEVGALKDALQAAEDEERATNDALRAALEVIPNLPLDDVPEGRDEDDNIEVLRWGEPTTFAFPAREHFELGEGLGLMDFEMAAKLSGARFVVLKGALARLERALAQFMLDQHVSPADGQLGGYTEVNPPMLVRDDAMYGTSQLPKFAEDLFKTEDGFWLIPTAEVPLTNLVREQTLDAADLPKRFTAHTPCFRSEAGAAGRDTRGMIRQHQFTKVELVSVTTEETALAELERMTANAERILQLLKLPYRKMLLSTGDMGFGARKTYDLEVWLPGQNAYREISSCSVCGDFQARRMNARYRATGSKELKFCHTLNGSGLAVGRALIAVLETNQRADGTIAIPDVLRPYMGGMTEIAD